TIGTRTPDNTTGRRELQARKPASPSTRSSLPNQEVAGSSPAGRAISQKSTTCGKRLPESERRLGEFVWMSCVIAIRQPALLRGAVRRAVRDLKERFTLRSPHDQRVHARPARCSGTRRWARDAPTGTSRETRRKLGGR